MQAIEDFLREWTAAEQSGDAAQISRLVTDDFVATGPLGFTLAKQDWLARFGGGLRFDRVELDDVRGRVYGPAAVVTARQNQGGTAHGNPVPEAARVTLALVEDAGRWRAAGAHFSFVAGTKGAPPVPGRV